MNWCSNVALLATFLVGLTDCQSAALASERDQVTGSQILVSATVVPDDSDAANEAADPVSDEDEKLTISKVMKLAHKSGLLKKVATGKATDAEITNLHKFYSAMPKLAPPKGEEKSWQKKTAALMAASKAAVDKDPNAGALLKSATNCAACHKLHKQQAAPIID